MNELLILAVSDSSFLPFIRTLFHSIKENVRIPYKFHLHAINVPDKKIESLQSEFSNIEFSRDELELDDSPDRENHLRKSKKAAYCANIRAKVIYDLMCKGKQYILYLDADSIVKKDLNELLLLIQSTDLIIFRRDNEKNSSTKVLTSVIGINNNYRSLKFIEYWKECMLSPKNLYSWFSDQRYFFKAMEKRSDTKVSYLPFQYVDSSFSGKSFIWNGKGSRKFTNIKYIREMEKYR